MSEALTNIMSAAVNRSLTHSAFRLYAALAIVLDGESPRAYVGVSVEALKATVPGVRGKPLGDSALRVNLRELQEAGLISTAGSQWSKFAIQVKLLDPPVDPLVKDAVRDDLLNLPAWMASSQ